MKHSTLIDSNSVWQEYYIDFNAESYEQLTGIGLIEKDVPVYQLTPDPSIRSDFETLMRLLDVSMESRLPDIALRFLCVVRDLINQGAILGSHNGRRADNRIEKSCFDFNRAFDKRSDCR